MGYAVYAIHRSAARGGGVGWSAILLKSFSENLFNKML